MDGMRGKKRKPLLPTLGLDTMKVEDGFQQIPYEEPNPYVSDPVVRGILQRYFPEERFRTVDAELTRYGDRIINEVRELSGLVSPPTLTQYDHFGRRIDRLTTSEGWRRLLAVFQEEGIVAIPYERPFGALSRVFAFAKCMLAAGDAQVVFCPLSMTDGAARVIQLFGTPEMKRDVYPHLISRDPLTAWTAGQWMTERPGGSDLSETETVGIAENDSLGNTPGAAYKLDGFKWFSSAPDGDISLALARTNAKNTPTTELSLFLISLKPSLAQNGIRIHRLKNKGGTHALPTAELELANTPAHLVGQRGKGIRTAVPLLSITRLHSATGSLGYLRRALCIARNYALIRRIRGVPLASLPVHVSALAEPAVVYAGLSQLVFGTAVLLGRVEGGEATREEEYRLRVLTPVVKAFCARHAGEATVACMEALGGLGYMEESGLPRLIRDGLVERIWEGTATIISLDLVRATSDERVLEAFTTWLRTAASSTTPHDKLRSNAGIQTTAQFIHQAADALSLVLSSSSSSENSNSNTKSAVEQARSGSARAALNLAGYAAVGAFLLEHALWAQTSLGNTEGSVLAHAERWAYTPSGGIEGALWALQRTTGKNLGLEQRQHQSAFGSGSNPSISMDVDLEIVYGHSGGKGAGIQGEFKTKL